MSNQPKSKSGVIWGLVAGVLIALVLVVGIPAWRDAPRSATADPVTQQDATSSADPRASASASGGEDSQQSQEPAPPPELMPMPNCWNGLVQFDQNLSLDNFRSAIDAAISRNDQFLMSYLEGRLTEFLGNNPKVALQVLDWAEVSSGGMDTVIYMEALKRAPAVQHPKVAERLLSMSENPKGSLAVRAAALIGLETQKRMDAASLGRLTALAVDATQDARLGWNATRTIGRVMEQDYKNTGTHQPYWQQLLSIAQKSEEPKVRLIALEMPSYSNQILDGKSIDALSELMRTDRDRLMREMAALRLSHTDSPEKALEAYGAAFPSEHELCNRWALMRFAARVAGPAALPLMQQFAQQDPRLQQDYLDFKELYEKGLLDWERVWLEKKLYHDCSVEEGAPH